MSKFDEIMKQEGISPNYLEKVPSLSNKYVDVWLSIHWSEPDSNDPLQSIKDYPATLMFYEQLERAKRFGIDLKNYIFFSAGSGNFATKHGFLAMSRGLKFVPLVPYSVPKVNLEILMKLGMDVIQTAEAKTCPRLETVGLIRQWEVDYLTRVVNNDQYRDSNNPRSQGLVTAKNIFAEMKRLKQKIPDYIICELGTGGTFMALYDFVKHNGYETNIVGVQPAKDQGVPGAYRVLGKDCEWTPEVLSLALIGDDISEKIKDVDWVGSYGMTALAFGDKIYAGPSTGMGLAMAHELIYKEIAKGDKLDIVVISPDNTFKYPDDIVNKLNLVEEEIIQRYPEFGLENKIIDIKEYLTKKANKNWVFKRVQECYSPTREGKVYSGKDIQEIIEGRIPIVVGNVTSKKAA